MDKTLNNEEKVIVSVVMPVYNSEKYLRASIESILKQTFSKFEFIIINDGSTDNSENIILSYNDKRIKYFKQENRGISYTLNKGCSLATGEFIARMDSDDISRADRLEYQLRFLINHTNYVLVGSSVSYINNDDNLIGRSIPYVGDRAIKYNLRYGNVIAHPTVMFRKKIYDKTHGYNKEIKGMCEDYILWLEMINLGKFYNLFNPLISYRIDNDSWYFRINQQKLNELMFKIYETIHNNKYEKVVELYNEYFPYIKDQVSFENRTNNPVNDISRFFALKKMASHNGLFVNLFYFLLSHLKSINSFLRKKSI